jgi:hypothetical protein
MPILGTDTFSWMVHVVGSGERPFSTMTPREIEELYLVRQRASTRRRGRLGSR